MRRRWITLGMLMVVLVLPPALQGEKPPRRPRELKVQRDPPATQPVVEVAGLSDEELIQEFEAAGFASARIGHGPVDGPPYPADRASGEAAVERYDRARGEIALRGEKILPRLLEYLRREVPKNRKERDGGRTSFSADTIELLVWIDQPEAVPVLMEVMEGMGGRASAEEQKWALRGIEQLTMCRFRREGSSLSVEHPALLDEQGARDYAQLARKYQVWLASEGKDPSRWLRLAQERARKLLDSPDLQAVATAADFLAGRHHPRNIGLRDDDPDDTLRKLARIMEEAPGDKRRWDAGPPAWAQRLCVYGPRARPHVPALLRVLRMEPEHHEEVYDMLRQVGGAEVMAFLAERLAVVDKKVSAIRADPALPKSFSGDDIRLSWFGAERQCQLAFDLWAGRTFGTSAERLEWWERNRARSARQWLEENLELVVMQADQREWRAVYVARRVLPELPADRTTMPDAIAPWERRVEPAPTQSRVDWLKEHRQRLRYVAEEEAFRVDQGG